MRTIRKVKRGLIVFIAIGLLVLADAIISGMVGLIVFSVVVISGAFYGLGMIHGAERLGRILIETEEEK